MEPLQVASLRLAKTLLSAKPDASIDYILEVVGDYGNLIARAQVSRDARVRKQKPLPLAH